MVWGQRGSVYSLNFHRQTDSTAEDDSMVLSCMKMSSQHGILKVYFIDLNGTVKPQDTVAEFLLSPHLPFFFRAHRMLSAKKW